MEFGGKKDVCQVVLKFRVVSIWELCLLLA